MTVFAISAGSIAMIAAVSHEVNRAWCEHNGDTSQKPWAEAPDWQKESAVLGVNFHLANPDAGDSASHDSWMAHKVADGWTYGEVKDETAKTHPCLLPFDQLPPEQQFKDRLFRTIVHGAADNMPAADEAAAADNMPAADEAAAADSVPASEHAELAAERDQLRAERDNLAADLDKAVARYQVARRKNEGKGRAVGVLKTIVPDGAIAEALDGPVELVFSDGKKEITGIDPVHVSGRAAWVTHPTGQMLRDRVLLAGPAPAEGVFTVAGVGLLVDGKQVGWCAFHDPLSIAGGATVELRDSIIF